MGVVVVYEGVGVVDGCVDDLCFGYVDEGMDVVVVWCVVVVVG